MPSSHITLHHLVPDTSRFPLPQYHARIAGTGILPPSTVVLDFMVLLPIDAGAEDRTLRK